MVNAADGNGVIRPTAVPSPAVAPTPQSTESLLAAAVANSAPAAPNPATDQLSKLPETATVKSGDTLSHIAARYNVSMAQLKQLNPQLFTDGTDAAGKKRGADGRLIYPGEAIRLRAAVATSKDPVQNTTVSKQVVTAAKSYLDSAQIVDPEAGGGKGQQISRKVVGDSQKMLTLIPASDPEHPKYQNRVEQIFGEYLEQYPDPKTDPDQRFDDASKSFNKALRAFQNAGRLYDQMPREDVVPFQRDMMQRALDAYTYAAKAIADMPAGSDRDVRAADLEMMEYGIRQMGVPKELLDKAKTGKVELPDDVQPIEGMILAQNGSQSQIVAGGGTDQPASSTDQPAIGSTGLPLGDVSGIPAGAVTGTPVVTPGATLDPNAALVSNGASTALPLGGYNPYGPAVQPLPGQTGVVPSADQYPYAPVMPNAYPTGYQPPANPYAYNPNIDGSIPMYVAKPVSYYTAGYRRTSPNETGTSMPTGATGPNNPSQGTANPNTNPDGTIKLNQPGEIPGQTPSKKDPNDPKVKQLWEYLKNADHQMVRDLISKNFDMFYASLPEQKALMIKILLDGRTNGEDQAAIVQVADLARQQGESDAMLPELDRLEGGQGKGMARMLEDLTRGPRALLVKALLNDPPANLQWDDSYYLNVVSALDKKDIEGLTNTLGSSVGSKWISRMPRSALQIMADKVKSWWPFGDSALHKALVAAQASATH